MGNKFLYWIIICLFVAFAFSGCSTSSSTTKTETVTTQEDVESPAKEGNQGVFKGGQSAPQAEGRTKEEKRTVTEERKTSESRGVISTTWHFIGQVLAFPFKVIAGVIEFIF